jgi:glycosyltransferase involved in cell wall biosynthesis
MTDRRVLHVLPHAGGGAETYIDVLRGLDDYRFEIFELTASRSRGAAVAGIVGRQAGLLRAARRADLIHAHGEVASLVCLPLLSARRSVIVVHGLHLLRRLKPGMPQRFGRAEVRTLAAAADRVICSSQAEFDDLLFLPERLRAKIAVVRNSVPMPPAPDAVARARKRSELGLTEDAVAVLYLGQLEPRKDPHTVVRAVARAHREDSRIVLLVAGAGPSSFELASLAGAEARFLGQRRDGNELLDAVDVLVMPSQREGMSFAILEALGHGVATVVSDGAGNPETVDDAGLVFPVGDEARLASLLLELAADPTKRAAIGSAGRARLATELSTERMLSGTRAVYEAVLTAPGRGAGGPPA